MRFLNGIAQMTKERQERLVAMWTNEAPKNYRWEDIAKSALLERAEQKRKMAQ